MKSESIKELALALTKLQSELKPAKKDAKNPFFKSSYADLASIWQSVQPSLEKNGLSVSQTMWHLETGGQVLRTYLFHTSGEWIMGEMLLMPVKNDPQAQGSAITYAKRYSLAAILGVVTEDDDGEAAQGRNSSNNPPISPKVESKPQNQPITPNNVPSDYFMAMEPEEDGFYDIPTGKTDVSAVNKPLPNKASGKRYPVDKAVCEHPKGKTKVSQYDPGFLFCFNCGDGKIPNI